MGGYAAGKSFQKTQEQGEIGFSGEQSGGEGSRKGEQQARQEGQKHVIKTATKRANQGREL